MIQQAYLNRIGYQGKPEASLDVLFTLHQQHLMTVPFENLDIQYGKEITLTEAAIYEKVVENYRGGFCYELNQLFHILLADIGFKTKIIGARIYDIQGELGPAYDHMCILVEHEQTWLLDVGFGDLFLQPIALLENEIQTDGRNYYKIEQLAESDYLLLVSANKIDFDKKYIFSTEEQPVANFSGMCLDKQMNPDSYFVKNRICTRPTPEGRITLFNEKLIHKQGEQKKEYLIENELELRQILKTQFNIIIK